jgi:3-oxoacyl-[acyl-carrier protein] reductase
MILQATSNDPPKSDPAAVVFIGWDQAPHGMEGDAGQMFAPVKAGVMAFAASLAQHVAPHVRVNTIAPGWIQTAWGASTRGYWQDRAKQQSLMHRWGTPEDVARAVVYVTDPKNSFLNGQTINVNGGWNRKHSE